MFLKRICSKLTQVNPCIVRNVANYPKSRAAEQSNLLLAAMEDTRISSASDWGHVRSSLLEHRLNRGQFTKQNIDAMIIGYCASSKQYDLGASYLSFLSQENLKPNLATLGKYLKLLYDKNRDACLANVGTCPKEEEELILQRYQALRKDYPVLDSFTLESAVLALSLTTEWKECLRLLQEIRVSASPTTPTFSAVVSAAFLSGDEELAWELLDAMLEIDKEPASVAFLSYINVIRRISDAELAVAKLERLCWFFHDSGLKCQPDVAASLRDLAQTLGLQVTFTTVPVEGKCRCCEQQLDKFELTSATFATLKQKLLQNVIVGRDVFVKSNPEELERFKRFVSTMGQFDVVLDGLNVAYSSGTKQSTYLYASNVASVVSYFVGQRRRVLVLGRVHMSRWPQKFWGYVERNATLFLTQDVSQDDPYLLYCALNSGRDTVIVTRDLMRGQKFLLRDINDKRMFKLWLSQRQYQLVRIDSRRGPIFRQPPPFTLVAQKNGNVWHIPYETDRPKDKNEFHETWLCLQQQISVNEEIKT